MTVAENHDSCWKSWQLPKIMTAAKNPRQMPKTMTAVKNYHRCQKLRQLPKTSHLPNATAAAEIYDNWSYLFSFPLHEAVFKNEISRVAALLRDSRKPGSNPKARILRKYNEFLIRVIKNFLTKQFWFYVARFARFWPRIESLCLENEQSEQLAFLFLIHPTKWTSTKKVQYWLQTNTFYQQHVAKHLQHSPHRNSLLRLQFTLQQPWLRPKSAAPELQHISNLWYPVFINCITVRIAGISTATADSPAHDPPCSFATHLWPLISVPDPDRIRSFWRIRSWKSDPVGRSKEDPDLVVNERNVSFF